MEETKKLIEFLPAILTLLEHEKLLAKREAVFDREKLLDTPTSSHSSSSTSHIHPPAPKRLKKKLYIDLKRGDDDDKQTNMSQEPMICKCYRAQIIDSDQVTIWTGEWFFTRETCIENAKEVLNEEEGQLIIYGQEERSAPTVKDLLTWITSYECMEKIAALHPCVGCENDLGSQLDHMEGCLSDNIHKIRETYDDAVCELKATRIMCILQLVLREMRISANHPSYSVHEDVVKDIIRNGDVKAYIEERDEPGTFPQDVSSLVQRAVKNL